MINTKTQEITKSEAKALIENEQLTAIKMYNGKFILVIDDLSNFEILNPEDAATSPFALATSIRGVDDQIHYVYFVDPDEADFPTIYMGYYEVNDVVKDNVLSLIDQSHPEMGIYDIDDSYIPLVKDENGKYINAEESFNSPLIGLFPLLPAEGNFYANYGIRLMRVVE